jgi:chitinase
LPDKYCHSGCPPNRVRIALDTFGGDCQSRHGGQARCCLPKYTTEKEVSVSANERYTIELQKFLENPVYENEGSSPFERRDLDSAFSANASDYDGTEVSQVLESRKVVGRSSPIYVHGLLTYILNIKIPTPDLLIKIGIWNHGVQDKFTHLQTQFLLPALQADLEWQNLQARPAIIDDISCNLAS